MTNPLERETRLKNGKYWALQEFDTNSKQIGRDQEPLDWVSVHFTASDLCHYRSIRIETPKTLYHQMMSNSRLSREDKLVEESETIDARLHSGTIDDDGERLENSTSFSVFGSDHQIKAVSLRIYKLKDGDNNECCWLSINADRTTIIMRIYLSSQKFSSLTKIIESRSKDFLVQVGLCYVDGFYCADIEREFGVSKIKILAQPDNEKIVYPNDCNITPPTLGEVGVFSLNIVQRNKLNPWENRRGRDASKPFEEQEKTSDPNTLLLAQLSRNEIALAKIRTTLWLIFVILLLASLKLIF